MLSTTNTINDVKTLLMRNFSSYGFADDTAFIAFLQVVAGDVYRIELYPSFGASLYSSIAAKDKVGLSISEEYAYWAEVNFICAEFLDQIGKKKLQTISGGGQTIQTEGYSQNIQNTKDIGIKDAAVSYYRKAEEYMKLLGYDRSIRLKRGGNFFTDGPVYGRFR